MKRHVLPVWLSLVSGCGAASSATGPAAPTSVPARTDAAQRRAGWTWSALPPARGQLMLERYEFSRALPTDLPTPPLTRSVGGSEGLFLSADGALFAAMDDSGMLEEVEGFPPLVDAAGMRGTLLGLDAQGTLWALGAGETKASEVTKGLRGLAGSKDRVYALGGAGQLLQLEPQTFARQPVADAPACVRRLRAEDDGVAIEVGRRWSWIRPARSATDRRTRASLDAANTRLRRRAFLTALADGRTVSVEDDTLVSIDSGEVLAKVDAACELIVTGGYAFSECAEGDGETRRIRVTALTEGGETATFEPGAGSRGPVYGAGPWVLGPGPDGSVMALGPTGAATLDVPLGLSPVGVFGAWWVDDSRHRWVLTSLEDGARHELDFNVRTHRVDAVEGGFVYFDRRRERVAEQRRRRTARRAELEGRPSERPTEPSTFQVGSPTQGVQTRTLPDGATAVAMATVMRGVAAGAHAGRVWTTEDGGATWQRAALPIVGDADAVPVEPPQCTNRACTVGSLVWFDADALPNAGGPEMRLLARAAEDVTPAWTVPCSDKPLSPSSTPSGIPRIECESESACTVSRRWFASTSDEAFLKTARIVPAQRDGQVRGFKLYGIRPGSPAKALQFKNGDLIVSVDGTALDSPEAAQAAWKRLRKRGGTLLVVFQRKGESLELRITFE